jgi:hypothetical protein
MQSVFIPATVQQIDTKAYSHIASLLHVSAVFSHLQRGIRQRKTPIHEDMNNHRRHRDKSTKTKIDVCIQIINFTIYFHAMCTIVFNHFYSFNICLLNLQFYIHDIISQFCVFLCRIPPLRWPKKRPKHVGGLLHDYTFVSNCCTIVGINTVKLILHGT